MPDFYDDKSEHVLPFVLERMKIHEQQHAGNVCPPPFFLGINGVQGIGKTTLVCFISNSLCLHVIFCPVVPLSIVNRVDCVPKLPRLALSAEAPYQHAWTACLATVSLAVAPKLPFSGLASCRGALIVLVPLRFLHNLAHHSIISPSPHSHKVSILRTTFSQPPHNLPTAVISIDDLYLPHEAQASLARSHPTNPLIQHRGQPSTHDLQLGSELFSALVQRRAAKVPVYDKSRFQGEGDRVDESEWETVNGPGQPAIRLVMFEGWCVGFRARGRQEVQSEWEAARSRAMDGQSGWRRSKYKGRLAENELENLMFVDDELRRYDILTE